MKISKAEQDAIKQAVVLGEKFGYGNIISHLRSAWARRLHETDGIPLEASYQATSGGYYSVQMHVDLLENGEWDETGKKYS